MTAVGYISIECDGPDPDAGSLCEGDFGIAPKASTAPIMRRIAADRGWIQVQGEELWDICPTCQRIRKAREEARAEARKAIEAGLKEALR